MSAEDAKDTTTEHTPFLLRGENDKRLVTETLPDIPENREFIGKIKEIKKYISDELLPKLPSVIDKTPFEELNDSINHIFDEKEDDKNSQIETLFSHITNCTKTIIDDDSENNLLHELKRLFDQLPFIRIYYLKDISKEHKNEYADRYFDKVRPLLNQANYLEVLGNDIIIHLDNFQNAVYKNSVAEWFILLIALTTQHLLIIKDNIFGDDEINENEYLHITDSLINCCIQYIGYKPEIKKNKQLLMAAGPLLGRLFNQSTEFVEQMYQTASSNPEINLLDTKFAKQFHEKAIAIIQEGTEIFSSLLDELPRKYFLAKLNTSEKKQYLPRYFSEIRPAKNDYDFEILTGNEIKQFIENIVDPINSTTITEWYIQLSILCCNQLTKNKNDLIGKEDLDVITEEEFNIITGSLIGICAEEYIRIHGEKLSAQDNITLISAVSSINESDAAIQLRTMINKKIRDQKESKISPKSLPENTMKKIKSEILDTSIQAQNQFKAFSIIPANSHPKEETSQKDKDTIFKRFKILLEMLLKPFSKPTVQVSKLNTSLGKNGKIHTDHLKVERKTDTTSVKMETPKPTTAIPKPKTAEVPHKIKVQPSPQYDPEKFIDGLVSAKKDDVFNELLIHTKQDEENKIDAFKKVEIEKEQLTEIDKKEQMLDYRMQIKQDEYFEYHSRENEYIINDKDADLFDHLAAFLQHCGQTKIRISQLPSEIQNDAYNFLTKHGIEVVDYRPAPAPAL